MDVFSNSDSRHLLIEVFRHVDFNSIHRITCLNKYVHNLCKTNQTLRQIVVDKKTDKFIQTYERLYSNAPNIKIICQAGTTYVEMEALGRTFSSNVKLPAPTPAPPETLSNSIMVDSIRITKDLEILQTLKQRCMTAISIDVQGPKLWHLHTHYIPMNTILTKSAILHGCPDIVKYMIELDEPENYEPYPQSKPGEVTVTQIPGQPGKYLEMNHRFIVEQQSDFSILVLGVQTDSGQRELTRREGLIARKMGLKVLVDDDEEDDEEDEEEDDHQPVKLNSSNNPEFINGPGFKYLLERKNLLTSNIFSEILNLLMHHPEFECVITTLTIALEMNDLEVFQKMLERIDSTVITEADVTQLIKTKIFTHLKPHRRNNISSTKLTFLGHNGYPSYIYVNTQKLMLYSDILTHQSEIDIPFPVRQGIMQIFVNGVNSNFTTLNPDFVSGYTGLQDIKDVNKLLTFFRINLRGPESW